MDKRLLILSVGFAFALLGAAQACSSDNTPSNFPPAEPEEASFSDNVFNVPDGTAPGQDGPVNCTPQLPSNFKPTWKPPTKSAACTTAELTEYYENCLGNISTPDGGGAGGACTAWEAAHETCAKCVDPTDNTGPIQWYKNRLYFTTNVAGCMSILRNEPEDGKCPAAYDTSFVCQRESCKDCLLNNGANFNDFQACQEKAKDTGCKDRETARGNACGLTYNTPDGGAYSCFPHSDEIDSSSKKLTSNGAKTFYPRLIGVICGP